MITMKDIVREGHPALREKATEVTLPPSDEDIQLLNKMLTFLKNSQDEEIAAKHQLRPGVGLAAPQLGIKKRMMAVHFEDLDGKQYSNGYFNPRIVGHSVAQTFLSSGEGCLSVDREVPGYVPRYKKITVKATDLDLKEVTLKLKGYSAIVFQHELDHLNGIMFYDHINEENPFHIPENASPLEDS